MPSNSMAYHVQRLSGVKNLAGTTGSGVLLRVQRGQRVGRSSSGSKVHHAGASSLVAAASIVRCSRGRIVLQVGQSWQSAG